jgi:predicted transcriptional regulator
MKHTPCEYIVWYGLPIIRKEIVVRLINDYDLSQKKTAEKLGISYGTVSQYLSGKRGNMNVVDKELCKEINISAERISQQGNGILVSETCRLCKIFTSKNWFSFEEKRRKL